MLDTWEKYLTWSPNTMRTFETNNALYHGYNPDAYAMASNPDLSVWQEIEDLTSITDLRSLDYFVEDFLRSI